jgi:hypothetical protein
MNLFSLQNWLADENDIELALRYAMLATLNRSSFLRFDLFGFG